MSDPDVNVRMYSVAQLAELWSCGTSFVYDEIKAQRLRTVRLGNGDRNKLRIRACDAEAWTRARLSPVK